jgi:hypothetical protein
MAATGHLNGAMVHYRSACDLAPNYGAAHYALAIATRHGQKGKRRKFALYQRNLMAVPNSAIRCSKKSKVEIR